MTSIELFGPRLVNKGDDMMLKAVLARLGASNVLAATPRRGIDAPPREAGLKEIFWPPTATEALEAVRSRSRGRSMALAKRSMLTLVPSSVRFRKGFVRGSDVRTLLDCSGFAYGDQWSPERMVARTHYFRRLKDQGARLIMLPQALGPFESPAVRSAASELLATFDLIFVRESASKAHVDALQIPNAGGTVVPDLTHTLRPKAPEDPESWRSRVCVIPNKRMLDKTEVAVRSAYVAFLVRCMRSIRDRRLTPCIVLHEANDRSLAAEIGRQLDFAISVYDEPALETKGILGSCRAVISSRYHGLVSALSQATPTLGTSWTHKYDALFSEYGCSECLVSPLASADAVEEKLDLVLDESAQQGLRDRLAAAAERQKVKVDEMWKVVTAEIERSDVR